MTIPRRRLLALGTAIGLAPLGRVFAQSTPEPIRIGFLTVKTGPLAAGGKQQEEGAALFIKERGGMLAGRKVELITQDTTGNPATAKTKTRELYPKLGATSWADALAPAAALGLLGPIGSPG